MIKRFLLVFAATCSISQTVLAEGEHAAKEPEPQNWSWAGPFGKFDRQQLQRGYLVYKDVCAACHSMSLVSFRNLSQPGGPEFTDAQMKAIARAMKIEALNDVGEMAPRDGIPADRFPLAYPNEKAARAANNNAFPPDLSVIVKARAHGIEKHGPDYVYSLLLGYQDAPGDFSLLPGLNYNPYFEGQQIAMPAPLTNEGQVTYADGNPPATKEQMAKDVVAFMTWAADPKMEERKELGVKVVIFLIVLSVLLFIAYKRLWKDVDH